ncbi:hypothetical protein GGR52DRAFT_506027 [Hypoxylon sp. FL1284]|nr:hypothetical protein GGR52DRAFT_506027 [Hypoxylon sp. FL1284]
MLLQHGGSNIRGLLYGRRGVVSDGLTLECTEQREERGRASYGRRPEKHCRCIRSIGGSTSSRTRNQRIYKSLTILSILSSVAAVPVDAGCYWNRYPQPLASPPFSSSLGRLSQRPSDRSRHARIVRRCMHGRREGRELGKENTNCDYEIDHISSCSCAGLCSSEETYKCQPTRIILASPFPYPRLPS